MRVLVGFFVFSLMLGSQAMAEGRTEIGALGDSITAGVGVDPGDAFPVQLQQRLKADGYPAHVINGGVSGSTTADGLQRLNSLLSMHPDMVIIELGINDFYKKIPVADIKKNLAEIIDRLRRIHVRVLLAGSKAPVSAADQYAQNYNAIFPALAKEYDVLFYPNFMERADGILGLMQADNIHPTRDGVSVIVDDIAPVIEYDLFKTK